MISEHEFSKTLLFSDINYQAAKSDEQEKIFVQYCKLLNYVDPKVHLQFNILNKRIDEENFHQQMLLPLADDNLDEYRQELNQMLQEKISEGQNNLVREKYLTFSVNASEYRVVSIGTHGRVSEPSVVSSCLVPAVKPLSISLLQVQKTTGGYRLAWKETEQENIESYKVYRVQIGRAHV